VSGHEQLSLFDASSIEDTGHGNGHDDLLAAVRARVAEPGLSDDEIQALVEDALARIAGPDETRWAKSCGCIRPLVLPNAWLAAMTCTKCGRRPREVL
jgi:hypothetical protein